MADDFEPIDDGERAAAAKPQTVADVKVPIVPIPEDVQFSFRHPAHGAPATIWPYWLADGGLVGYAARFEFKDADGNPGKDVMPLSYCDVTKNGKLSKGWRAKGFPNPRPLYNLPGLSKNTGPILFVEGEKAADAAMDMFQDYHATTTVGGSKGPHLTDFGPLANRVVVIWPDADEAGRAYALKISGLAYEAGATEVRVVDIPKDAPAAWDLADDAPEGWSLREMLESAIVMEDPGAVLPRNFVMRKGGIYYVKSDNDEPPIWVCDPLKVLAATRDGDGLSWGILLQWHDRDGRQQEWAMPKSLLAGEGTEVRRVLLGRGLNIASSRNGRDLLFELLCTINSKRRALAVQRTGWHDVGGRQVFVLPSGPVGDTGGELVRLQTERSLNHSFRTAGTLKDWQESIAKYAVGNSRLVIAISTSIASPLLKITGSENGGIHLRGGSSIGKSTALEVAGSVWGGGGLSGYVRQWRATDNGLEFICSVHSDALLCLDELSQIDPRAAGVASYMIGNGSGKVRMTDKASARPTIEWRLLFLSTGEISLADKVSEDGRGRRVHAGQGVRVVDLPADAGQNLGLFENLHGFPSADAFARHLKNAASRNYGTAASAFIEAIQGDLDAVAVSINKAREAFKSEYCPVDADGQVQRVVDRFALIAAAGEAGILTGVLPWPPGEAVRAARICLDAWLSGRGTSGPAEISEGIAQVRSKISAHGLSRFHPAWSEDDAPNIPPRDLLGYRRRNSVDGGWDFFATADAWKREFCAGFDPTMIASALADLDLLTPGSDGRMSRSITVPDQGKIRLYEVSGRIMEGGGDGD
jgi:putative DNA primase/helicase